MIEILTEIPKSMLHFLMLPGSRIRNSTKLAAPTLGSVGSSNTEFQSQSSEQKKWTKREKRGFRSSEIAFENVSSTQRRKNFGVRFFEDLPCNDHMLTTSATNIFFTPFLSAAAMTHLLTRTQLYCFLFALI